VIEDYSRFNYSSNQQNERQPIWKPKETNGQAKPSDVLYGFLPPGCCEFVGVLIHPSIEGRRCIDHTFCPKRLFSDPKFFASCPTRKQKLKDKEQT